MPFELANQKDGPDGVLSNFPWLYEQDYVHGENHVTECMFKWFFFSTAELQSKFLVEICGVKRKDAKWTTFNLQKKGKTGTPDAMVRLKNGKQVLFEVKIKQKAVSRKQLKRHLKDAGLMKILKPVDQRPSLVLITPDFDEPKKLGDLPIEYKSAIQWVTWVKVMHFFSKKIQHDASNSLGRALRTGLVALLEDYLKSYIP